MTRTRLITVIASLLLVLTAACGSSGSTGGDAPDADDADTTTGDAAKPITRLTKVIYNGTTQYEFSYGPDGEPQKYRVFHPVTGDPQNEYVVDEIVDGVVTKETVTPQPTGEPYPIDLAYADGRLASSVAHVPSGDRATTYAWNADEVTLTSESTTIVYQLDEGGNITEQVTTGAGRTTTITYLAYDDAPNPFTLTGGMAAQIWSANNALRWTPDAGCEYVAELTYDDAGLPLTSYAEGCAELSGRPIVHDYVYEYAEF